MHTPLQAHAPNPLHHHHHHHTLLSFALASSGKALSAYLSADCPLPTWAENTDGVQGLPRGKRDKLARSPLDLIFSSASFLRVEAL